MLGRPPPPPHRRAGLALVGLVVVALALGAVAPAASAAPSPTDDPLNGTTTDTVETATETTDDATSTVETATDDAASGDEATGTATEDTAETASETSAGTVDTVNQTADEVDAADGLASDLETTTVRRLADAGGTDLTTALATTVNGTTDPLSVTGQHSVAGPLARSEIQGGEATPSGATGDAVDSTTGSGPSRSRAVAPPERTGPTGPLGPLPAGLTAAGGLLVGAIALRQGLGVGALSGLPRSQSARAAAEGVRAHVGWRDPWRWLGGLFGYQRYDDSDPLEHETRGALLKAIEETDAPYLAGLARAADVPLSTARYHLRILEQESAVRSVKLRGKRLYVPAGEEPSALEAALADDGAAAVLESLANGGPDTVSGLAARLGRDVSTVTHHLQALESAGLVERERDGRAVRNRLAPAVRETMRPTDGSPATRARSD